jgi:hypothetical protein
MRFHSIPLGNQIVRGQKMVLYAVVKFTADDSRHPLLYDPKNPIAKQWVSPDGDPDGHVVTPELREARTTRNAVPPKALAIP